MTYIPNFTTPNVIKSGTNFAKHLALNNYNFSYVQQRLLIYLKIFCWAHFGWLSFKVGVSITKKQQKI